MVSGFQITRMVLTPYQTPTVHPHSANSSSFSGWNMPPLSRSVLPLLPDLRRGAIIVQTASVQVSEGMCYRLSVAVVVQSNAKCVIVVLWRQRVWL